MLEPSGPLPPEIYWRRRALAIGVAVVALALVIWIALSVAKGGDSPGQTAAATSTSQAASSTSAKLSSTTTETDSESATSSAKPSDSATSTTSAPVAQGVCADQSLAIKVTVERPTYKVGEQPVFGIVITNISSAPCSRDLGSALQQISVTSLDGQQRIWTSTDCNPDGAPDQRTLNRGEQAAFTVTWMGATSQPGCAERVQVPAGAYAVVAQLGAVRSSPEPFNFA